MGLKFGSRFPKTIAGDAVKFAIVIGVGASLIFGLSGQATPALKLGPLLSGQCDTNDRVKWLFDLMRNGTYGEVSSQPELDTAKLTWENIPALIKMTDNARMLHAFPESPISSASYSRCSEGMVALWLIEGIRTGRKFPSLAPVCFKAGDNDGSLGSSSKSESHRPEIANLYRQWWDKAKCLPHEDASKLDPLKGSGFSWY
jgi:hypothetical protein